jgi:BlaI family penicillinase repressor
MKNRLADSEWIILKALWGKPPQTMKQIVQSIRQEQPEVDWGYKTYHTYLRNMCTKNLLFAEERNLKDKLYSPLISQEEALRAESENLLSRRSYFGSVGRLVMMMAEDGQLTGKEQKELIHLAQKLERESENEDD